MGRNYLETGLDDIIKNDPVFTNYFNLQKYLKHNTLKISRFFKVHRYPAHFGNIKRNKLAPDRKIGQFYLDRKRSKDATI